MDTSEKYIKMCEMAWDDLKWIFIMRSECPPEKSPIWRQDQLQDMLRLKQLKLNTPDCFVKRLFHWTFGSANWEDKDWEKKYNQIMYAKQFESMEQLLFAFMMKEKYDKIWSDKKGNWIKEEK